jgi:hypothetical protein
MFSREESKKLRLEFWDRFYQISAGKRQKSGRPAKWIMNDTGIRQLKLKFHFDEETASVGIDIETRNPERRTQLYQKLLSIRSRLEVVLGGDSIWEPDHILPSGKNISRVRTVMRGVSIYQKDDWEMVIRFFYEHMNPLEDLFNEFRDFLKYANAPV